MRQTRNLRVLGTLALAFFAIHAANHLRRGEPHDLMWICNLAPLVLGIGCVEESALLGALPFLWLSFGTPLWLLDISTGGELIVTAILTHVGGLVVSIGAVRLLGMPNGSWYKAAGVLAGIVGVSRLLTPREYNVNLSHSVWAGWESYFPNYGIYFALLLATSTSVFFATERLWTRLRPVSEVQ